MAMFKKAQRSQAFLKLLLSGPSGSGKTLSALYIAAGLLEALKGGKLAVIDSENGSASLYVGQPGVPEFDTLDLEPPYSTEKYLQAMATAKAEGYSILIIDSLSHQWSGDGGILSRKEQMDARGGNSYTNWGKLTPEQEKLKAALLQADLHLIGTVRSKQDYALVDDGKGKMKVQKLGMAPVQRDGMEYEFTTVFDLDMAHQAAASKDRTGLFDGKLCIPSAETGKQLYAWLKTGVAAPPKAAPAPAPAQAQPEQRLEPEDAYPAPQKPPAAHAPAQQLPKPLEQPAEPAEPAEAPKEAPKPVPANQAVLATASQKKMVWAKLKTELKYSDDMARAALTEWTGKKKSDELTKADIQTVVGMVAKLLAPQQPPAQQPTA